MLRLRFTPKAYAVFKDLRETVAVVMIESHDKERYITPHYTVPHCLTQLTRNRALVVIYFIELRFFPRIHTQT